MYNYGVETIKRQTRRRMVVWLQVKVRGRLWHHVSVICLYLSKKVDGTSECGIAALFQSREVEPTSCQRHAIDTLNRLIARQISLLRC